MAALDLEKDGSQQQVRRVGGRPEAGIELPKGAQVEQAQGAKDEPSQMLRFETAIEVEPLGGSRVQGDSSERDFAGGAATTTLRFYDRHGGKLQQRTDG